MDDWLIDWLIDSLYSLDLCVLFGHPGIFLIILNHSFENLFFCFWQRLLLEGSWSRFRGSVLKNSLRTPTGPCTRAWPSWARTWSPSAIAKARLPFSDWIVTAKTAWCSARRFWRHPAAKCSCWERTSRYWWPRTRRGNCGRGVWRKAKRTRSCPSWKVSQRGEERLIRKFF